MFLERIQREPMKQENLFKINYTSPIVRTLLQQRLIELLSLAKRNQPIIIVCIGTDRSTGDSLGPLVGTYLYKFRSDLFHVYGTIAQPVHALNLVDTINHIKANYDDPFIIAIDACLGQSSSVGYIQSNVGPVRPGAGVNKQLPEVGDVHITAVVNVGGFMEYFVLQNTRLHLVMSMSDIISHSLYAAIVKHFKLNSNTTHVK